MLHYQRDIEESGYIEKNGKPNLFYKNVCNGYCYLDMRGTKNVPIWEYTTPLFYAFDISHDEKIKELKLLYNNRCPFRQSFNSESEDNWFKICEICEKPEWEWEEKGISKKVKDLDLNYCSYECFKKR